MFEKFYQTSLKASLAISYERYGENWFKIQQKFYFKGLDKEAAVGIIVQLKENKYYRSSIDLVFDVWDQLLKQGKCSYDTLPGLGSVRAAITNR